MMMMTMTDTSVGSLSCSVQRVKLTLMLLIVVWRACCSVALVADDLTASSRQRHHSPADHSAAAAAQYDLADHSAATGSHVADRRQVRWATAAHQHVLGVDCQRASFSTERECRDVRRIERARWNVYMADPRRRRYLHSVLPDGPLGDVGRHQRVDGVVALDPYPDANFGHLVLVFHVTIAASASWCQRRDGFIIGKKPHASNDDNE